MEKQRKLDEKIAKNKEKTLQKLERKAILEEERRKKPGECQKYVRAIIDESLVKEPIGSRILNCLNTLGVKYELKNASVARTIYWQRSLQQVFQSMDDEVQLTEKYQDEKELLHVMNAAELNELVKSNQLLKRVKYIKTQYPSMRLTVLVFGIKEYCHITKPNVGRMAFETALTEMQLLENVGHRLLDTAEDIGQVVGQFTKSVAEMLYKKDRDDKMSEQNFYLANDNKDCVDVKNEIGLSNLWQHHLCKFPTVTLEIAEAIMKVYPTPAKLIEAYQSNNTNGELLLADLQIRRAGGPQQASRKIGVELSRRIHDFYTNSNPDYVL